MIKLIFAVITFVIVMTLVIWIISIPVKMVNGFSERRENYKKVERNKSPIWPDYYQPRELWAAWREPIPFKVNRSCPHCSHFAVHTIAEPRRAVGNYGDDGLPKFVPFFRRNHRPLGDHPNCAHVRHCDNCEHVWGER